LAIVAGQSADWINQQNEPLLVFLSGNRRCPTGINLSDSIDHFLCKADRRVLFGKRIVKNKVEDKERWSVSVEVPILLEENTH
jgi:hypothetical protein